MCDGARCGFVVHLCFNVGELVVAGWVFRLLQVMEISPLHGDGFWKGVQEDKYGTQQGGKDISTMFWDKKDINVLSF
jgi:hypothetical protein